MFTKRDKIYIGIIVVLLLVIGALFFEYRGEAEEKRILSEQILQRAGSHVFFARSQMNTLIELLHDIPTDPSVVASNLSSAMSQFYQLYVASSRVGNNLMNARSLVSLVIEYGAVDREGLGVVTQILDDASSIIHGIGDTATTILFLLDRVRVVNGTFTGDEDTVDRLVKNIKALEVYKNMSSEIKWAFDRLNTIEDYLYHSGVDVYSIVLLQGLFKNLKRKIDNMIAWEVYGVTTTVTPTVVTRLG